MSILKLLSGLSIRRADLMSNCFFFFCLACDRNLTLDKASFSKMTTRNPGEKSLVPLVLWVALKKNKRPATFHFCLCFMYFNFTFHFIHFFW